MKHGWRVVGLVVAMAVASAPWASAGHKERRRRAAEAEVTDVLAVLGPLAEALGATPARADEAPRLLAEALRTGTTDTASWASIVRWVLTEREEKVAAGLAAALQAAPAPASGPDADRWNATAAAVAGVFAGALHDAETHTPRDGDAIFTELVTAAAPAVVAALSEVDPQDRDRIFAGARTLGPSAREMVGPLAEGLRHAAPAVRLGAATALGALGPAAREAVPALRSALDDPDPDVRAAAAQALERIRTE
jgi:HEAT repeat protein